MAVDLPLMFALIIALAVAMYVLLDGFDLGLGVLFWLAPSDRDRDVMMQSAAPIWDGNETWLVLGGATLLGAFPAAYAIVLSATYLPLMVMLFALVFRGVAFEFRFKSRSSRRWWDAAFAGGSTVAAFSQGVVLGAFIDGFAVAERDFAGGPFDWLSPFTVMTGCALVAGYALLGAGWIILKTEGPLQSWAFAAARWALILVGGFIVVVSLWTPVAHPAIAERWFGSWPRLLALSPVPVLTALVAGALWRALDERHERTPFLLAMVLFLLCFVGLGVSLWPYAVPRVLTIWEAASPPGSQLFLLVGLAVLIPIIIAYSGYNYWVFRGKVRHGEGYEH